MDLNSTIDIIIKDLEGIRDIIEDFRSYPEVPELQVELAISKCRHAEELMALLKKFSEPDSVVNVPVHEKEKNELITGSTVTTPSEVPLEKTERNEVQKSSVPEKKPPLQERKEEPSTGFRYKTVADLSSIIRTNDRFLFIREIFGGKSSAYEDAITKLNKVETLADARAIIMSYTGDSIETEAVSQLLELVKRKLPSDG